LSPGRYRGKGRGCYEKRATDPVGLRRLRRIAGGAVMMVGEEAPMPDLSQMVSS